MKQLTKAQIIAAADELQDSIKNWRLIDSRGEFLVFRMPAAGNNLPSSDEGEKMAFWRFDTRHAAERFRNRKIVTELASLAEAAAS